MELSSALNQRLRELQEWQQVAILTIRKAFTFDDVEFNVVELTSVLNTGFVLAVKEEGYGFICEDSWILACPDAGTRQIVVSKCINGKTTRTRIDTIYSYSIQDTSIARWDANLEAALQREIINFLALVELKAKPIDW